MIAFLLSIPLLAILTILLTNCVTVRQPRSNRERKEDTPRVSILIPARNEEVDIARTVAATLDQQWDNFEVLVLDDHSTDGTRAELSHFQEDKRFSLLTGKPLKKGWLGKPFACHQLSLAATGELLLFVDADVVLAPHAVAALVSVLYESDAGLVTAFPKQQVATFAERAIVPMMDFFVYALLPIRLANQSLNPNLVAATGQISLFKKDDYQKIEGHQGVRDEVLEDIGLATNLKSRGTRVEVISGTWLATTRMYRNWPELLEGFSKNAFLAFGRNLFYLLLFILLFLALFLGPFAGVTIQPSTWLPLVLVGAIRLIHAARFGHSLVDSVILHPLSCIGVAMIALESARRYAFGKVVWKSRTLASPSANK